MPHDPEVLKAFTRKLEAETAYRALSGSREWPAWMCESAKAALKSSRVNKIAVEYFIERIIEWQYWGDFLCAGEVSDSHRDIGTRDFFSYHRPKSWTKGRCEEVFDEMFAIAYDATMVAAIRQMGEG